MADKDTKVNVEPMKLFEPIQIGPVRVKNRVAMAPMNCLYADPGGYVSEQTMAWYAARAKGGAGLIIIECVMCTETCSKFDFINNLKFWNLTHMAGMTELAETVHFFGGKIFIQMCMGFGCTGHTTFSGERSPAPSEIGYEIQMENMPRGIWKDSAALIPRLMKGDIPREYTVEEIQRDQDAFANSAKMAVIAGFDGIEIHSPHGYLLHQFLSPRFNKRTDQYGGSLENRQRCLIELYQKTREAVGHSIAIGVRASAQEYMPGGISLDDTKVLVQRLEELGVDYFHLSNGSYEAMSHFFPEKDGANIEDAKELRKMVKKMPIITPSIHNPELAEKSVREGVTDMVSLGRQLIADPEWANKVANGDFKGINKCIKCNACCLSICLGKHVRCSVNPDAGREKYMPQYQRPSRPKGQYVIVPPQAMAMVEEKGTLKAH